MWRRIWRGVPATLPIALGVAPFGLAYGAVASQGMDFAHGWMMSLVVFAGTAQFITASMVAQGAAFLPILVTALLVNLRIVLLSAALVPHMRREPRWFTPVMAHAITDETFAVTMAAVQQGRGDGWFLVGSGLTLYTIWQLASVAGLLFGSSIPSSLGLEYALPASLICLLFLLIRDRRGVACAAAAALLAVVLGPAVSGTWTVTLATFLAATGGVLWKRWR